MQVIWNPEYIVILVNEIRAILKKKDITQKELALLTDLHENTICYILSGKVSTSHESIMRIVLALELDFNEFFGKVYRESNLQMQKNESNEDLINPL